MSVWKKINKKCKCAFNGFLSVLFPSRLKCVCCDREIEEKPSSELVCEECYKTLSFISGHTCEKCSEPLFSSANYCLRCKNTHFTFLKAYSRFVYAGKIRELIHKFKFSNQAYLADFFAKQISNTYLLEIFSKHKIDAVCYVPMFPTKEKERGYNQSKILAQKFCELTHLEFLDECIVKRKDTLRQSDLNHTDRKKNIKGAFKISNKELIFGKTILLIDDIFTTGSSAEECSEQLISKGAVNVVVLTIAHTVLNSVACKKKQ